MKEWYSLSQEYFSGENSFLDLKVKVLRLKDKDDTEARSTDYADIVSQYILFTRILSDQIKTYGRTEQAIRETIRICENRDILKEYLMEREKEVVSIMTTLFSQEEATKIYVKNQRQESRREGRREGIREGQIEGLVSMVNDGLISRDAAIDRAARKYGVNKEDFVKKLDEAAENS